MQNCLTQEGGLSGSGVLPYLPYDIEVFLEIPHDAALEKSIDVFIFPLLTSLCYKITA